MFFFGVVLVPRDHEPETTFNPQCVQGTYGCKNEKRGGDTCNGESSEWQLYMVYFVYRSFKFPPPVKQRV